MIHSTHSEFISNGPKAFPASGPSRGTYQFHGNHDRVHIASGSWPSMGLAEPEIDSLWDTGLLDRLSLPITRYHE